MSGFKKNTSVENFGFIGNLSGVLNSVFEIEIPNETFQISFTRMKNFDGKILYENATKNTSFIVDKIERERSGTNITYLPNFNGFIGLAKVKDSKNVPYGEYLKNRKLIPANTLAIEL
jgi:hypothetical protein